MPVVVAVVAPLIEVQVCVPALGLVH